MKHHPSFLDRRSLPARVLSGLLTVIGLAAGLGLSSDAQAQRVIRIVVPFGPGAVQDTLARVFNNELGQIMGATVLVENRAGAGEIGRAHV